MPYVVTLENFRPPRRYDAVPWANAIIEEAATYDGVYAEIDTVALSPADADPSDPALRSFTTDQGTAEELWYRIYFEDGSGNVSLPTTAIQNAISSTDPYATVEELARILKLRTRTADQTIALQRVLEAAAAEINSELDLTTPLGAPPPLVVEVNLERAVEHWRQQEVSFGIVGLGDTVAAYTGRDTWERHAFKLAPLKEQFGVA